MLVKLTEEHWLQAYKQVKVRISKDFNISEEEIDKLVEAEISQEDTYRDQYQRLCYVYSNLNK